MELLRSTNDSERLAKLLEDGLRKRKGAFPADHPHIAFNQLDLARTLIELSRYKEASSHAGEAFRSLKANPLAPARRTREAAEALVSIHESSGGNEDAQKWKDVLSRLPSPSPND